MSELMRLTYTYDSLDRPAGTALGITLTAAQAEVLP
jgi:hypothetical protein